MFKQNCCILMCDGEIPAKKAVKTFGMWGKYIHVLKYMQLLVYPAVLNVFFRFMLVSHF